MMNQYAIVQSRFNEEVTAKLLEGALERFAELGIDRSNITVAQVPGAVEIPLIAKTFAKTQKFQAIVCLGAVILGETNHYDYVCNQVSEGCQRVMLDHEIPVIFGVLTTSNAEQAFDRVGGKHGHKGKDAVDAAIEMVELIGKITLE